MDQSGILLLHLACTLFMTGLIWFVQIVHYPLLAAVGEREFCAYETAHQSRTSLVVSGPMLLEGLTAGWLLAWQPTLWTNVIYMAALVLLVVIWLSTAFLQMPLHQSLSRGYDVRRLRWLVQSNWLRTIAWTVRGGFILHFCHTVLSANSSLAY
ncbi:MAG: hypothetical protein SFX18_09300 [Pirellulales bacterium]|nr:hypothetical protein [Pirellulales bacterium]